MWCAPRKIKSSSPSSNVKCRLHHVDHGVVAAIMAPSNSRSSAYVQSATADLMSTPSCFAVRLPASSSVRHSTRFSRKVTAGAVWTCYKPSTKDDFGSHAMQSESLIKCAHPPCRCIVEVEDQFCSTACASKPPLNVPCPCGHPECVASKQTLKGTKSDEFDPMSRDPQARR